MGSTKPALQARLDHEARPQPRKSVVSRGSGPRFGRLAWVAVPALIAVVALALFLLFRPSSSTSMTAAEADLKPAPIDGDRAFGYLKAICALGPRPAGSEANTKQREMVAAHFKKLGATVREQPFSGRDPLSRKPVAMVNLIGSWFPDRTERVLITAHYDTRPFPDQEPDPIKRKTPFLGANDGGSGVALMMELAHHLKELETPWGVDLVLLDGEELVYGQTGTYFLGSKAFGAAYQADRRKGKSKSKYVAGFLLDMVGGRQMELPREPYSVQLAPNLVRDIWTIGQRLDCSAFQDRTGPSVLDDHLALNDAGIPTIDIINFEYAHWHTAEDTLENCSGASLAQVGKVLTAWLNLPKAKPRRR